MADSAQEEFLAPVLRHPAGAGHRVRSWVLGASRGLHGVFGMGAPRKRRIRPDCACAMVLWSVVLLQGWACGVPGGRPGVVAWDGLLWRLDRGRAHPPVCGRLEVALDLQRFLLVRLVGQDGRRAWLGLEPAAMLPDGPRCAVRYIRAPDGARSPGADDAPCSSPRCVSSRIHERFPAPAFPCRQRPPARGAAPCPATSGPTGCWS